MKLTAILGTAATLLIASATSARADGYCDHVEGVAQAESAVLLAPELFGSFGYIDQTEVIDAPDSTSNSLRLTAGLRIRLDGFYEASLVKRRAKAECRRRTALDQVTGETTYKALEARAKVLEDALDEAAKYLDEANNDLERRRSTAPEVTATKLRVDALRELAADTRKELDALPAPREGQTMARALSVYQSADAEVERTEGKLRKARAWDVSVRFGYDKFLENDDDDSPYFAVVSFSFNTGWFLQGKGNKRAAAGRKQVVEEARAEIETSATRLQSLLAVERQRAEETGVLVADLERQLAKLEKLEGEDTRKFRETVWFEWVKVKAEHAYLLAHVQSLEEILGEDGE